MKRIYSSSSVTGAPLSGAIEINGVVFVSGQIHADAEWKLHGDTIEEKFDIVISNIQNILKEASLTLNDIVFVRIYVTNIKEMPALNAIYKKYFSDPLPARTAIAVSALPLGASLEIEVIASRQ
jgi:2-iminobutanoate/2-iminopropanoate deaminase